MEERKTTRSFRNEDGVLIAVKQDEFTNGRGKKIVQVVEEHNITEDEIKDVLNKHVPDEIVKLQKEKEKINQQLKDLKKKNKGLGTREFIQFKEELKEKQLSVQEFCNKNDKLYKLISVEQALESGEKKLAELERTAEDILAWKDQFSQISKSI